VHELIDLDLKFPEYRSAVLTKNDFTALNPGYVVAGVADHGKSTFVEINIMTIAILAWGSLIWNQGSLHIEGAGGQAALPCPSNFPASPTTAV